MVWLIGFVFGVTACATLPALPQVYLLWLLAGGVWLCLRFLSGPFATLGRFCLMFVLGLSYAAWRAEARLAQDLPPAWEMKPIQLVVVIRGLATDTAKGQRMVVQVEQVETPGARVPAYLRLNTRGIGHWPGGSRWPGPCPGPGGR